MPPRGSGASVGLGSPTIQQYPATRRFNGPEMRAHNEFIGNCWEKGVYSMYSSVILVIESSNFVHQSMKTSAIIIRFEFY